MMKFASMTMEDDSTIGMRASDAREPLREHPVVIAPRDVDTRRMTARGRWLRKLLILGNILGWILLFLAARAIFF